jgi:pimeloyl-ACP methyl ester carboxylesterase
MNKSKKLLTILLTVALVLSLMPAAFAREECPSAAYTDVKTSMYYHDGVDYMLKNGFMSGTSAAAFSPDATLSRGMVVTVLYSMAGKPAVTAKNAFKDVKDGAWYAAAATWAVSAGVAKGNPDGTFDPNADVTRQQLACFLDAYAASMKLDTSASADLSKYKDASSVAAYAKSALGWCVSASIITGAASDTLNPQGTATRGQFAVMAYSLSMLKTAPAATTVSVASTTRTGVKIPAYVTLPYGYDKTKTYPMVMLCHGHGGNHNEWGGFDKITNGLAREGIIAVTLDYPGCGASSEKFTENTLTNMKADTLDVINYVTSSYSVNKSDIGIFGYSMGGRITLELLAQKSYNFAAVEFVAPAEDTTDLKTLFGGEAKWSEMKAEAQKNGYASFTTIYGQTQQLSYKWFTDLEATSDGLAESAAKNYSGHSMVVYATNDEAVSPSVSAGVAKAFGSAVVNTYADGHSYSFYGKTPYTVSTVNEASVNFFKDELLNKDAGYVASIGSDGSLALTIKASAAGVKAGDTVKVTVDGVAFTMPVAADAASAVKGQNALIISGDTLTVSLVGGDFATANKIAAKTVAENGAVQWYYTEATAVPAVVSISK